MKTNQIFNFKRFNNYAKSSFLLHNRQLLMMVGAVSTAIFIVFILSIINSKGQWNGESFFLILIAAIAGVKYIGSAFPQLRSNEKAIGYLTIPASSFEKFFYELIERLILFCLIFPVLFFLVANLAIIIGREINAVFGILYDIKYFSYQEYLDKIIGQRKGFFLAGAIFILIIAFAGAATFRKNPLVKTFIFGGAISFITFGYFYFIVEQLKMQHPWIEAFGDHLRNDQGLALISIVLFISSLIVLAFAYFKLKEREVS